MGSTYFDQIIFCPRCMSPKGKNLVKDRREPKIVPGAECAERTGCLARAQGRLELMLTSLTAHTERIRELQDWVTKTEKELSADTTQAEHQAPQA